MARFGQVDVDDRIACIIRRAALFADTDAQVAMAIAMAESNFDPNAEGDDGRSIGLFQLYVDGGQGSDYANNPDALKDPVLNANIAIRAIAVAVLQFRDAGLNKYDYFREVARHSGHPGMVDLSDQRLVNIANDGFKLIFNSAGQLAPWPPYNAQACADVPAPPPPIGTWAEPLNPANKDDATTVIEAHLARIDALFRQF